eukprot:GHVO01040800.1.p1 GENE.GHVO01040800.1~~GHVO01040800.1.p1  ORF type:complete len:299 (-),score=90.61 GHVO01040800.1:256-1125(-)
MFHGVKVSQQKPALVQSEEHKVLHVSSACLHEPKNNDKTTLYVENNKEQFACCTLQKDKAESAPLDLFLLTDGGSKFVVKGSGEVHLVGYFEPEGMEDDEDDMGGDSDDEEEKEAMEKLISAAAARHNAAADEESQDEVEDMDVEDVENIVAGSDEDDDDADDDDEDEEEEEEEEKPAPAAKKAAEKPKGKKAPVEKKPAAKPEAAVAASPKKRKDDKPAQKPTKQAKVDPDAEFETTVKEYLKKHGKTSLSLLGGKLKKPEGVSTKLGQFIRERGHIFKVQEGAVSLK